MPPLEQDFAAALLDPERDAPAGLLGGADRFAVYRNNVTVGLIEVLRSRFPVTAQLVGEAFFAAMARGFLRRRPPASPLLQDYGDMLPDFIEGFAPAASLPYLADVARLEAAWTQAYHAADAPALPLSALGGAEPAALLGARLALHPAARLLRSPHPIVGIWTAHQQSEVALPAERWRPEQALILRPEAEVTLLPLAAGEAELVAALDAGVTVADAGARALAAEPALSLGTALLRLVRAGAFATLSLS